MTSPWYIYIYIYVCVCVCITTVLGFNFAFQKQCVCLCTRFNCATQSKSRYSFSDRSAALTIFSLPFLPLALVSFSPPSLCCPLVLLLLLLLLSPPSLLDWWSKHRKRAGSVPPRQSWGWAFLQSSCAGVKSLLWFSFHLSSANHSATLQRLNFDPCKEFHSKDGLTPVSQLHPLPSLIFPLTTPFPFFQLASFMCWQSLGEKDSRNEVRGETESTSRPGICNHHSHALLENYHYLLSFISQGEQLTMAR